MNSLIGSVACARIGNQNCLDLVRYAAVKSYFAEFIACPFGRYTGRDELQSLPQWRLPGFYDTKHVK